MTKSIVRAVQPNDELRWRGLFQQYVLFYEASVPDDVVALTWQRILTRADGLAGFVSLDDCGAINGFAVTVMHRSSWSPTWYCYLEDLFVDPACRGAGVGRALIEAVYADADARGASRTYWATQATNSTARALYDRIGNLTPFVQYRRESGDGG
jgi:GNAT superfamily N-acetyltransferase